MDLVLTTLPKSPEQQALLKVAVSAHLRVRMRAEAWLDLGWKKGRVFSRVQKIGNKAFAVTQVSAFSYSLQRTS
jgi:hypothetical protein